MDDGGPRNELEARRRDRDNEPERMVLRLFRIAQRIARRRHHHDVVGDGRQCRQHAYPVNDKALVVLPNNAGSDILDLCVGRPGAINLRADQRMGRGDVGFPGVFVIGDDILAELAVGGFERLGRRAIGRQHHIHEIRAAAKHAAGMIAPDLEHVAPRPKVFGRARLNETEPDAVAAGRRDVGHPVNQVGPVLQVVELRLGPRTAGKARVGRNVSDALAVAPDLAPVVP